MTCVLQREPMSQRSSLTGLFSANPITAASASPTPCPPPAASGPACRPGGASVSSRCPPGVCRVPDWDCWAALGSWGRPPAAPAAPPPAPSRADRYRPLHKASVLMFLGFSVDVGSVKGCEGSKRETLLLGVGSSLWLSGSLVEFVTP